MEVTLILITMPFILIDTAQYTLLALISYYTASITTLLLIPSWALAIDPFHVNRTPCDSSSLYKHSRLCLARRWQHRATQGIEKPSQRAPGNINREEMDDMQYMYVHTVSMYMNVTVYAHVCIYVYICIPMEMHSNRNTHVHIYIYKNVCIYIYI